MTPDEKYNDELNDQELEHILSAMKGMTVPPSSRSKEESWNLLMQSVVEEESKAKVVAIESRRIWFAVAASVVIMLVASWSYVWFSSVEKYSPKGYFSDVVLPDGSQIKLNAETKVRYPKFYNLVGRKIHLEGEAFFMVKPGAKFTVSDSEGRIVEVVGTEFNVNSRNTVFKVTCYSGAVNVEVPQNKPIKLTKGLSVDLEKEQLQVKENSVDSISSPTWTIGEFYFQGAKLADVFEELERQFNVSISVEGFNAIDRTYTGFFRNSNLKDAMDLVALPMGLSYEISSDSSRIVVK